MYAPSSTDPCVPVVANFTPKTNLVNLDAQSAEKRIFREARNVGTDIESGLPNPKSRPTAGRSTSRKRSESS
ncbi:hypothetical protein HPB48_021412 [Haemaphysalis longicornis]|uniref:Uncharacterized protein n=1 Tax=Haemaphysalis longicornis TaxID=44386 RepID=A0A9J6FXX0_HAELO|nr:hypothetical protein HPB48_021412 [Haemaphysalis longicornis]